LAAGGAVLALLTGAAILLAGAALELVVAAAAPEVVLAGLAAEDVLAPAAVEPVLAAAAADQVGSSQASAMKCSTALSITCLTLVFGLNSSVGQVAPLVAWIVRSRRLSVLVWVFTAVTSLRSMLSASSAACAYPPVQHLRARDRARSSICGVPSGRARGLSPYVRSVRLDLDARYADTVLGEKYLWHSPPHSPSC